MESWRGGQDAEGWKIKSDGKRRTHDTDTDAEVNDEMLLDSNLNKMEDIKEELMRQMLMGRSEDARNNRPTSGLTEAVPRFKEDLEALLHLAQDDKPVLRCVRNKHTIMVYYGFGGAALSRG